MRLNSFSSKTAARVLAASALTAAMTMGGVLCGCTQTANVNNNVSNLNVNSDKNANVNASTNVSGGEAASVFDGVCSLKGNVIGAQHIKSSSKDVFMVSVLIEPDLSDAKQTQAQQSTWQVSLYFVAKDANGDYLGSWSSDTLEYEWTYGERIDDSTKHITANGATECQMGNAKTVDVYLTWAKGTFSDNSTIEYQSSSNLNLPSTKEGAETAMSVGQLFGSVTVDQMSTVRD